MSQQALLSATLNRMGLAPGFLDAAYNITLVKDPQLLDT